jgi:hypothetical protein
VKVLSSGLGGSVIEARVRLTFTLSGVCPSGARYKNFPLPGRAGSRASSRGTSTLTFLISVGSAPFMASTSTRNPWSLRICWKHDTEASDCEESFRKRSAAAVWGFRLTARPSAGLDELAVALNCCSLKPVPANVPHGWTTTSGRVGRLPPFSLQSELQKQAEENRHHLPYKPATALGHFSVPVFCVSPRLPARRPVAATIPPRARVPLQLQNRAPRFRRQ